VRQYADVPASRLVMISRTVRRNTLIRKTLVHVSLELVIVHTLEALAVDNGGTALVVLLL
jgi:hypothetical protein